MKLQQKIILISFGIVFVLSLFIVLAGGAHNTSDYFMGVGILGFFTGLLQLVVGLFLLIKTDKRYAQGFLISAGLLIVIGFATCTANFTANFH